jgi:hypothetical protein
VIEHILQLPASAIPYRFGQYLAGRHAERALVETTLGNLDFMGHAASGASRVTPHAGVFQRFVSHWNDSQKQVERYPAVLSARVEWDGHDLDVYLLTFDVQQPSLFWIVAATRDIGEAYLAAVAQWSSELRSEILVFAGGCFSKDDELYRDIKSATFENLILPAALKHDIRADITSFFASRELYARYRIPWKRGILFIGPPGNGKTHAVKALLNEVDCTCLYVKTFDLPHGQFPQGGVAAVFEHARRSTPCIVVLEDLDSLVGDHNRSFFLNELDGFAANHGVIVLATTNHPERLDPAILDRPSRFDRKYHFDLPAQPERERYLRYWNTTLAAELTLDETAVLDIAEKSDGFSFAYLRELFLSSSVRWISDGGRAAFATVLTAQLDVLREQMTADPGGGSATIPAGAAGFGMPGFMSPQQMMSVFAQRRSGRGGWTIRP